MPFPKTKDELTAAGYKYDNKSRCRGCNSEIEWWITPKGKKMPLDPGTMEPHWGTCPQAQDFRRSQGSHA